MNMSLERKKHASLSGMVSIAIFIMALALAATWALAEDAKPKPHLPNQGGFRNGQAMWDWMQGVGEVWLDGGSVIFNAAQVFFLGQAKPFHQRLGVQSDLHREFQVGLLIAAA